MGFIWGRVVYLAATWCKPTKARPVIRKNKCDQMQTRRQNTDDGFVRPQPADTASGAMLKIEGGFHRT
jgi:hypothetical protein